VALAVAVVALRVDEDVLVEVVVAVALLDEVALNDALPVAVAVPDAVAVSDELPVAVALPDAVAVADIVGVGAALRDTGGDALDDAEGVGACVGTPSP